jgi:hypothetical protein
MHASPSVNAQEHRPGEETVTLHLTRPEAELLEAQLARDLARMEDELAEAPDGPMLARSTEHLRQLDERLRELLAYEPLPDIV